MSEHKILVLANDDEDKIAFGEYDFSEVAPGAIFKYATQEKFNEGKRFDTFDMVLIYVPKWDESNFLDCYDDDLVNYLKFYTLSPVVGWITSDNCGSHQVQTFESYGNN